MKTENTLMIEELADCKNSTERQMLLQKYGIVEPKLTENEQISIKMEEQNFQITSRDGQYVVQAYVGQYADWRV